MSFNQFRGDALDVPQVTTFGITADDANTSYAVTINRKTVAVPGSGAGTAATAAALRTALSTSTIPEFVEIAWTVSGSTVTATSSPLNINGGLPFTVATSVSGGAGTMSTPSTTTNAAGHLHWDDPNNWSTGSVPATGDDVVIDNFSGNILYGLTQSSVTLNSLTITSNFTGTIGLPKTNANGYSEYRPDYLQISATTVQIGYGPGSCSGRIKLNLGVNPAAVSVYGTSSTAEKGLPALQILGSNAANAFNTIQGSIGLANEPNTTAQFPTVEIGSDTNQATDVNLICGPGCTLANISQCGGLITTYANVTTWTKFAGDSYVLGTASVTTLKQYGKGTHYWLSTGTLGSGTFVGPSSDLDSSCDLNNRTATNLTFNGGAYVYDPGKTITFTNAIAVDAASALAIMQNNGFGTSTFNLQRS